MSRSGDQSPGRTADYEALVRSYFPLEPLLQKYTYHNDCCFSPDGDHFAVISETSYVTIFQCESCFLKSTIPNKKYHATKSCFHNSKFKLYLNSYGTDHAARLLNLEKSCFDRYFQGHTDQITSLTPTVNGVITASKDNTIQVWADNHEKSVAKITTTSNSNIALHPNQKCLAVTSENSLMLYDFRNLEAGSVSSTRISPNGEYVPHFGMHGKYVMVIGKNFAREYGLNDLRVKVSIEDTCVNEIPGCSFDPEEHFIFVATKDNDILVGDTEKESQVTVLSGHTSDITAIAFSSHYHNFVSVSKECLFWTVDVPTFETLKTVY